MTADLDLDLDRRLAAYLAAEAPGRAPDRVLAVAMDRVDTTGQRRGRGPLAAVRDRWEVLTPARRALLVAASLLVVLGIVAAGAWLLRPVEPRGADLIVLRPLDTNDNAAGFAVDAIAPDGATRTIATYGADDLDGPWDGSAGSVAANGLLQVRLDGAPDGQLVVVDLRPDGAPPRYPDLTGFMGSWDASGLRIAEQDGESVVVYDLAGAASDRITMPPDTFLIPNGFPITWADDGTGFLVSRGPAFGDDAAPGGVRPAEMGTLGLDGSVSAGTRPARSTGIAQRRIREDGTFLRCRPEEDDSCNFDDATLWAVGADVTAVWDESDPTIRVGDFAWAADGGLWVITETLGTPTRTLALLRVDPEGATTQVLSLDAGADDPDPNSYCPGGTFAAMAPDDSRLIIQTAGDGCQYGPRYLVDVDEATATPFDGLVAGWLDPEALATPVPGLAEVVESPPEIRGDWGRLVEARVGAIPEGGHRLHIGRTTAELDAGFGQLVSLALVADGEDRIRITQPLAGIGCDAGSTATYRWVRDGTGIRLEAVDDPCPDRRSLLEAPFEPTFELAGNWEPEAASGVTYLVPEIGARVTTPSGARTWVWSRTTDTASLGTGEGWWSLEWPVAGTAPGMRGLEAALRHIDTLEREGVRFVDRVETSIDGRPAVTGRLEVDVAEGEFSRARIWPDDGLGRGGFSIPDGGALTILTGPDDRPYSIVVHDTGDAAVRAWADALTASLDFAGDGP